MSRFFYKFQIGMLTMGFALLISCRADDTKDDPRASPLKSKSNDVDLSLVITEKVDCLHGVEIENGNAYDIGKLKMADFKLLTVPCEAKVIKQEGRTDLDVHMKKTLGYEGQPSVSIRIKNWRNFMGCATRVEDNKLIVATFGEWHSKEGGASMKLIFLIPPDIQVQQGKGLSGTYSLGKGPEEDYWKDPAQAKQPWFSPTVPGKGWKTIPTSPDVERKFDKIWKGTD